MRRHGAYYTVLLLSAYCLINSGPLAAARINGTVTIALEDGTLKQQHDGVVVFLESQTGLANNKPQHFSISQKNKTFYPHVLAIAAGDSVSFPNDDSIFHNVFSLSLIKTFDLGIYATGQTKEVQFKTPGLVKIYCNIHPNMVSNILVLNNHFYSVSDKNGYYEINNLPFGSYRLRVWHEFSEEKSQTLELNDDEKSINLKLVETIRIKPHNNKFGRPYKSKYQ